MDDRVIAVVNPGERTIDVYARVLIGDRYHILGRDFTPGEQSDPTIRIPEHFAASIAVAIQECGLPSGKNYDRGKLEATERHLEDLRRLVFKKG